MPKITKRVVDALQPDATGRETAVWDAELKGFGVRMMPSGVASFFVYYRTQDGRQRKLTLGRVGTLTAEQARQVAREKLAEASMGADPSADRHKVRGAITIAELCDQYLVNAKGRVKASTLAMDVSRIERHVKPLIGRLSVLSLRSDDVEKMHADIIAGKTAQERGPGRGGVAAGGPGVASRSVGMLGTILEFGIKRKLIKENVARGIDRAPDGKQKRFLSLAEIKRLGAALREAKAHGESAVALNAIRFLVMSGCRRMEALALREEWIDRAGGCIRFPDTKSGAQIRPIGASALAALDGHPSRNGWVFPAARGLEHFVGLPKVLERVCARAKLDGVTVHVLRHSFAATAAGIGFSELTIAGLLGHTVSGVTARYAHVPDSALVAAADRVAAEIAGAMG